MFIRSKFFDKVLKGFFSPNKLKSLSVFDNFGWPWSLIVIHAHGKSIGSSVFDAKNVADLSSDFDIGSQIVAAFANVSTNGDNFLRKVRVSQIVDFMVWSVQGRPDKVIETSVGAVEYFFWSSFLRSKPAKKNAAISD